MGRKGRRGRRLEGTGLGGAGGRNLLGVMGEGPVGWDRGGEGGISTPLYTESQGELYRGEEAALLRAQRTGGTVRIKKADGIPRVGVQGDRKSPDMSSRVYICPKSVRIPGAHSPSHFLLKPLGGGACPPSGPAGAVGVWQCPNLLLEEQGSALWL